MNLAFIPQLGFPELVIILVVALLLFGGKKLPGLSRALGRSLSEFKRGKEEGEKVVSDLKKDVTDEIQGKKEESPNASEAVAASDEKSDDSDKA